MIAWTFILAFAGAAALLVLPKARESASRWIALAAGGGGLLIAIQHCLLYSKNTDTFQSVTNWEWIPALGIRFHIGADGISLVMLLLTGLIAVTGVLFSWNVVKNPRLFFALFLTIIGACHGVFLSLDVFLLFFFYELVIVPKFFLILLWGSTNREYGAMKLTLYSVAASALIFLGLMAAHVASGTGSFGLFELAAADYTRGFQLWAFPVLFLGFAVLAGIWPLHTWAPTGHVAAPTAASMLLAGVVMKLGSYGALRVAMPLFPEGLAAWSGVIAVLAGAGVIFGALAAFAQRDLKFVIGYSSIAHMGFVLLGLATLNHIGLSGAVMQMFSHGLIAGLLFAVVGRMIYERTRTRDLDELGGFRLRHALPAATGVFIVATAASIGLPGFSGFVAELSILIGAWRAFPFYVLLGGIGIVLTAAFSLRALNRAFLAEEEQTDRPPLPPLTRPEVIGAGILVTATVLAGIQPQPLLELIGRGLDGPLFEAVLQIREVRP